jgi:putative oxygen-independent coproporphyrinogen III oxidase
MDALTSNPLGVYVHVPYCSSRCGYCDFNTYVPGEVGRGNPSGWATAAVAETRLRAAAELQIPDRGPRKVATMFIGGGTPTLLPAADLGRVIQTIDEEIGFEPGAEITVEANPETVTPEVASDLLAVGVNRISIGMQSADNRVLRVLDRQHTPGGAVTAVEIARAAGLERISLDLIYGTPGEDLSSWGETIDEALATGVDHVSAYALKVESGTRLARQVRAGELGAPDDDYAADAYEIADTKLGQMGLGWYEISNWAQPGNECRHNLGYWQGADWWGIGPGAHGHDRGRRYWNVKNPQVWQDQLAHGRLAEDGSEQLTADQRLAETVMMAIRLRDGLETGRVGLDGTCQGVALLAEEGLIRREELPNSLVLTLRGRLLGDLVTHRILDLLES